MRAQPGADLRHRPLAIPGAWQGLGDRVLALQRDALRESRVGFLFLNFSFPLSSLQHANDDP